ncbi:hypothetical protein Aph02nite_45170 [Actinoplanes philippinensis]|nr:hypothetical protein Aph02nite_45170 [Actinoplanes philippinensis]
MQPRRAATGVTLDIRKSCSLAPGLPATGKSTPLQRPAEVPIQVLRMAGTINPVPACVVRVQTGAAASRA